MNFNTSNVTILLVHFKLDGFDFLISIHQMLLFYSHRESIKVNFTVISIHQMLLFYGHIGKILWEKTHFNTSNVTILLFSYFFLSDSDINFNTSNVTILPAEGAASSAGTALFQYIKCYYSTTAGGTCAAVVGISIHQMLLFYSTRQNPRQRRKLISIHQMLLFYQEILQILLNKRNFNTSNVTILRNGAYASRWIRIFQYIKCYYSTTWAGGTDEEIVHFNTSNVTILHLCSIINTYKGGFQYIKCYYSTQDATYLTEFLQNFNTSNVTILPGCRPLLPL